MHTDMKRGVMEARQAGREEARKALDAGKPRSELLTLARKGRDVASRVYDISRDRSDYETTEHFRGMLDVLETT